MPQGVCDHGRLVRSVYLKCLSPSESELPFATVIDNVETNDAQLCADLGLTQQLWRTSQYPLEIDAGTDEYPFNAPNFGRAAIAEVEVPAWAGSFAGMAAWRKVYLVDIQAQDDRVTRSGFFTGFFGFSSIFPFREIGFFRRDGLIFARVSPMPEVACHVMITFEPGPKLDVQDGEQPGAIEAYPVIAYPLLANMTAQDCLSGLAHKPEPVIQRRLRRLAKEEADLRLVWQQGKGVDNHEDGGGVVEGFLPGGRRSSMYWW